MFITLDGTAYRNGKIIGKYSRQALRGRVAAMRRLQKCKCVPDAAINARISDFTRILRKVVPHWLDEAKGLAVGAGVAAEDILMLNCVPSELDFPRGQDCSTFVQIGKHDNRLFKIRDERNLVQAFYIQHTRGCHPFQLGHQIGSLGVAHFFNGEALAGASNTGSPTRHVADEPKLDGNHVMRILAEQASSVDDLPRLLDRLLAQKVLTGSGKDRATILICADARKGLILEYHSSDYAVQTVRSGTVVVTNHFLTEKAKAWESRPPNKNTRLRRARMQHLLALEHNDPDPLAVFALSRDRKSLPHALCNDNSRHFWMTISAQLQVIDRKRPQASVNYVCCGNTRHSVYAPVPLSLRRSFVPLLSGAFYTCTDQMYRRHMCRNHPMRAQVAFEENSVERRDGEMVLREAYRLLCALRRADQGVR